MPRLSYSHAASFASLPKQLVYGEHGDQFEPTNSIVDYATHWIRRVDA